MESFRILHLSTDDSGGAGRAALRLHTGLVSADIDSQLLLTRKTSSLASVLVPPYSIQLYKEWQSIFSNRIYKKFTKINTPYSANLSPSLLRNLVRSLKPDLINLHFVGNEFLSIEELGKFNLPIVWTLHDMWPFTGGCHYSQQCTNYVQSCGRCPQLSSDKDTDISHWILQRKVKAWKDLNLTIVAPSRWMSISAQQSLLFRDRRNVVIPYGLDTQIYKPINQSEARQVFNLPLNKKVILFGAINATKDERKGFQLLLNALNELKKSPYREKVCLVVFGASETDRPIEMANIGINTYYFCTLKDDYALATLYSAADLFVAPSMQDNLPNTVIEALSCGVPCVAFNIGGMPDMVNHKVNGYLANPYKAEELTQGIIWILQQSENSDSIRLEARAKATQSFSLKTQTSQYCKLYKEVLALN